MVQLIELKDAVILFALITLIAGASALALNEFQDTQVTDTAGCNATVTTACGYAFNISGEGMSGIDNTTSFLGTIGVIIGVMALIGIVIASFRFGQ